MKRSLKKSIQDKLFWIYSIPSTLPFLFRKDKVEQPRLVSHDKWVDYLATRFNRPGIRVLEVGSRVVTGSNFRERFDKATYIGFDFYPGENVDVVGDAHKLSRYFSEEEFDLVFSSAVFEHFYAPWLVSEQISRVLKIGGTVFVETHFSFSAHERPWNFFQFSDQGLKVLFNKELGFEILDAGMSNPIGGYFSRRSSGYLRFRPVRELYCHSEVLAKKIRISKAIDWADIDLDSLVEGTRYPNKTKSP
jgi:SAM-dependent methyltransferase